MMKRILSFVLAAVLLVGLVPATVLTASAASERNTSNSGIAMIKNLEGFRDKPYQDSGDGKYYIGYGTCINGSESLYAAGITQAKAEQMLKDDLKNVVDPAINAFTKKNNLNLSQTQHDALACFSYNVGTAWLNGNGPLRTAILAGKTGNAFIDAMVSKNSHNPESEYFYGLIKRHMQEANLYLNGAYNSIGSLTYVILKDDTNDALDASDSIFAYDSKSLPAMPAAPAGKEANFLGWYLRSYNSSGALVKETPVYSLSGMNTKTLWPKWEGENSTYTVNANDLVSRKVYQESLDPAKITDTTGILCELMANSSFKVEEEIVVGKIKWALGTGKDTKGAYCKGWVAVKDFDSVAGNTSNKVIATASITTATGAYESASDATKLDDLAVGTVVKIVEKRTDASNSSKTWGKFIFGKEIGGKTYEYAWIDLACAKVTDDNYTDTNPYLGKSATVTNCAQLNVRNAAGMVGTTIINRIGSGTQVTIYETATVDGKVWARIKWGAASEGWVYTYYLNVTGVSNGASSGSSNDVLLYTGVVTSNTNLNVRQYAAAGAPWVTSLPTGTKVNIYEVTTTAGHRWGRMEKGWVCLDYVNLTQVQQSTTPGNSGSGTTGAGTGVTMYDVNAYKEADNNSQVMFTLKKGESIAISEQVPQKTATGSKIWGKVTVNGVTGWVNMAYVEVQTITVVPPTEEETNSGIDPVNGTAGVIANASIPVNVRIAAGVQNNKVASLAVGTGVTVYELTEVNGAQWARIKWNGNEGWVAKQYVNLTGGIGGTGSSNTANGTTPGQISLTGTVNSNIALNVRSGAGLSYPKVTSLGRGTKVTVYEQVSADGMLWGKVNVNGTSGWVCMSYISVEQSSSSGTGVMGTIARCFDSVNVRSAPGVGNAIVGKLKVGTRVEIYEQRLYSAQYWGRVAQGWICMEYVVTDGIVPEGPINTETTQETTVSSDAVVNNSKELVYNIKGTTIGDRQYIYKDATDQSGISGTIDAGQIVTILALKGDGDKTWGKINDYNTPGWIDLDRVNLDEKSGYTNTENQAIYAKPDTTSTVVQVVPMNTKVIYKKYAMRGETPYVGVVLATGVTSGPSTSGTSSSATTVGVTGWIPMSKLSHYQGVITVDKAEDLKIGTGSTPASNTGYAMVLADVYETYTSSNPVFKLAAGGTAKFELNFFGTNDYCRADGGRVRVKVQSGTDTNAKVGWIDISSLTFTASYKFTAAPVNVRVNTAMDAAIVGRVDQYQAAGDEITISALVCDASGNVWGKLVSSKPNLNNYWVRMDGADRASVLTTTDVVSGKTGYGVVSGATKAYAGKDTSSEVLYTLAAGATVSFAGTDYTGTDSWLEVSIGGNKAYVQASALASYGLKAKVNAAADLYNIEPDSEGTDKAVVNTQLLAGTEVTITSLNALTIDLGGGTTFTCDYIGAGYVEHGKLTVQP